MDNRGAYLHIKENPVHQPLPNIAQSQRHPGWHTLIPTLNSPVRDWLDFPSPSFSDSVSYFDYAGLSVTLVCGSSLSSLPLLPLPPPTHTPWPSSLFQMSLPVFSVFYL